MESLSKLITEAQALVSKILKHPELKTLLESDYYNADVLIGDVRQGIDELESSYNYMLSVPPKINLVRLEAFRGE